MVLILVLVEDGLGEVPYVLAHKIAKGLNPCFSGGWSRSINCIINLLKLQVVLILVLVEDGLGVTRSRRPPRQRVLILVLVEDGLGDL